MTGLEGKTVTLGVTGGIAAFKSATIVSLLKKAGAEVRVVMTAHAQQFIAPLTFETLSGAPVVTDMFVRTESWDVEHISLAKRTDLLVIAPATANIIAKAAQGIADDFLSTLCLSCKAPRLIAPAMNSAMLGHPATAQNIETLASRGAQFIYGGGGRLACGDVGSGRMAEPEEIVERIYAMIGRAHDMEGMSVLVTAGRTEEDIDPVRFITNRSSGKMGYAIAREAFMRGAQVTLVSGSADVAPPAGPDFIKVRSAAEMYDAVMERCESADIIIKTAAVADFTPKTKASGKIKKDGSDAVLELKATKDIAREIGRIKGDRVLVGFAAETDELKANAMKKLASKNLDMIAANDVGNREIGFKSDDNDVTLYYANGQVEQTGKLPKAEVARAVVSAARRLLIEKRG